MRKRTLKAAVVAVVAGTVLQLGGGCLGTILQQAVIEAVAGVVGGFIPDLGLGGGTTTGG
jgi:predicted membrane-bound spermidine synthase